MANIGPAELIIIAVVMIVILAIVVGIAAFIFNQVVKAKENLDKKR